MALTNPSLILASAATTAATGAEAKVLALADGLLVACEVEASSNTPLQASAQTKLADLKTEFIANVAEFQTALGL